MGVAEVVFPQSSDGARYVAAYRKWLGLKPYPSQIANVCRKSTSEDFDLRAPLELVVLSIKERAARCRRLATGHVITLRARQLWDVVPGEIVTVNPRKIWRYGGHPYLSGDIVSKRLDVAALGLVPLRLRQKRMWKPEQHDLGDEGSSITAWAKPIIARGPRPRFEMEQVLPGQDPKDASSDPITEANDLKSAGGLPAAQRILMELCESDLRCLDAHAHLGKAKLLG